MATIQLGAYQAIQTAISAASIANNAQAISGAIDNGTDRYLWHDLELQATYSVAPTANTAIEVYLIPALDGTNYADGDATIIPPGTTMVGIFPLRAVTTAQRIAFRGVMLPPGLFKYILRNNGTGQTVTATLRYRGYDTESV